MELRELTVGGLLAQTSARFPARTAMTAGGAAWTYEQLERDTDGLAAGLLSAGVGRGTHLGIWAEDRPETILALLAALKIGAVAVMLGACRTASELQNRVSESDVTHLLYGSGIGDTRFPELLTEAAAPRLRWSAALTCEARPGDGNFRQLREAGRQLSPLQLRRAKAAVRPGDTDMILFTSGSTDTPRGVVTTHFARANLAVSQAELLRAIPDDRFLSALPTFHCFSLTATVLAAFAAGACLCLPEDRHTKTLLDTIQSQRCTVFTAVPTLFSAILARPDLDAWDLSSLRTGLIGGSIYPPELFEQIARRLRFTLLPSLGQTEATAGITGGSLDDPLHLRARSVGRLFPHIEGRILDDAGRLREEAGVHGELCIRGYSVMRGYYHRPELTDLAIDRDGWLHTGDLGYLEEDGSLVLIGRKKELIIRGGENIAPGEVERVIAADPRVLAVKVIGVPDPHYGEELCACMISREPPPPEELRTEVGHVLAPFKVPRYLLYLDDFPVTGGGKTDVPTLKQLAISRLGLSRQGNIAAARSGGNK